MIYIVSEYATNRKITETNSLEHAIGIATTASHTYATTIDYLEENEQGGGMIKSLHLDYIDGKTVSLKHE